MLALRSCAYSMYTCIYAIYAVANITIDPIPIVSHYGHTLLGGTELETSSHRTMAAFYHVVEYMAHAHFPQR